MTNDECPRLTYSAIADNPEGGLAGKGGGGRCEPHGQIMGGVGVMGAVGVVRGVGTVRGVGVVGEVGMMDFVKVLGL